MAASGGFVLNSELRGTDGEPREVELQLRVPQQNLDAILERLRTLGTVLQERTTGQDVTEEFDEPSFAELPELSDMDVAELLQSIVARALGHLRAQGGRWCTARRGGSDDTLAQP